MRPLLLAVVLLAAPTLAAAMVVRHDLPPERFLIADEAAYPELFAIFTRNGQRNCVATVIAPRWAVTAAHCTESKRLDDALAGPGFEVTIAGKPRLIDQVVRHAPADADRRTDIALLRFREPLTDVKPARIYRGSGEVGMRILMMGWGGPGTGLTGAQEPDWTYRIAGNVIDAANTRWVMWRFDDPREGRADELEGISGPRDSGGPAFRVTDDERCLVGVSGGQITGGKPEGVYGVWEYYARVSQVVDWIDQVTGGTTEACNGGPA